MRNTIVSVPHSPPAGRVAEAIQGGLASEIDIQGILTGHSQIKRPVWGRGRPKEVFFTVSEPEQMVCFILLHSVCAKDSTVFVGEASSYNFQDFGSDTS